MKILKINNTPIIEYDNLYLTKELNKEKVLTFTLSPKHHELIENEVLVELSGHRYRVKEFTKDIDDRIEVYCEYDISELTGFYFDSRKEYTNTIQVALYALMQGSRYNLNGPRINKVRKLSAYKESLYEVIDKARTVYGVEIEIDNKTKTVNYWVKQGNQNSPAILSKDLNMTKLNHTSDTHEYFNVIEPRGKDGLSIAGINGGDKSIRAERLGDLTEDVYYYWEDERYEVSENLMEDAKELLAIHSKPLEVFEVDLLDLSSEEWGEIYSLHLGDAVKVWGINERHRVVKIVVNVNNEKDKVITLANKPISLADQELKLQDLVDKNDAKQEGRLQRAQRDFTDRFNKQKEEIDKDLENYKNEFDIELANAPRTTVEWLNKNTGILNGDTLMVGSIKSKHIETGSIKTHHIESGAITSDLITVDKLLAKEVASKTVISDLIMAGQIDGNKMSIDLTNGNIKTWTSPQIGGAFETNLYGGKYEIKRRDEIMARYSYAGYEFFPENRTINGGMYSSNWRLNGKELETLSLSHGSESALTLGYKNPTGADAYVVFDKDDRFGYGNTVTFFGRTGFNGELNVSSRNSPHKFSILHNTNTARFIVGVEGGVRLIFNYGTGVIHAGDGKDWVRLFPKI